MATLPPEISREVLRYLPVRSLLEFGLTSKQNYALQSCSLSKLRLGVFHTKLASMVSLMEPTADQNYIQSVQIILPKEESRTKVRVIRNQNLRIQKVVEAYQQTLRDLEVALWELDDSTACSIGLLKNLKRLSIRLDHPHTRFPGIDRQFWESSPGSTVWNNLACTPKKSTLGRLQSLNLERAGITDYQLAKVLESNPKLTDLRLQKCLTLTNKTFKILAESNVGRHIETLCFTKSDSNDIDGRLLVYIGNLPNLKVRHFR